MRPFCPHFYLVNLFINFSWSGRYQDPTKERNIIIWIILMVTQ